MLIVVFEISMLIQTSFASSMYSILCSSVHTTHMFKKSRVINHTTSYQCINWTLQTEWILFLRIVELEVWWLITVFIADIVIWIVFIYQGNLFCCSCNIIVFFIVVCNESNCSAAYMHLYWNNPNWHCRYFYTTYHWIIPVSIGYSRSRMKSRFKHQLQGNNVIFNLITVECLVNLVAWLFVCSLSFMNPCFLFYFILSRSNYIKNQWFKTVEK